MATIRNIPILSNHYRPRARER